MLAGSSSASVSGRTARVNPSVSAMHCRSSSSQQASCSGMGGQRAALCTPSQDFMRHALQVNPHPVAQNLPVSVRETQTAGLRLRPHSVGFRVLLFILILGTMTFCR